MSDSTRPDKKPVPGKPGPPGVGTPFAGESSSGDIVIPIQKRPPHDPNATIIDTPPPIDPGTKLVDADATLFSAQAVVPGDGATTPPGAWVRGMSSPRSPASPGPNSDRQFRAAELQIGDLLGGRYQLLQLLGEGGMGAVYKAADHEVDRIVALKVIRPEMASNPEILARFKQELLLSSRVTHHNVIRIYDLGEAQGVKFITMEYLDGENLHQVLKRRGKLEVEEAVAIMEQVASGLAAAHREGII